MSTQLRYSYSAVGVANFDSKKKAKRNTYSGPFTIASSAPSWNISQLYKNSSRKMKNEHIETTIYSEDLKYLNNIDYNLAVPPVIPGRRSSLVNIAPTLERDARSTLYSTTSSEHGERKRSNSLPVLFNTAIEELEEPLPNQRSNDKYYSTRTLPDFEGAMYVDYNMKTNRRWCTLKKNEFTIYKSFKCRVLVMKVKLTSTTEVTRLSDMVVRIKNNEHTIDCTTECVEMLYRWMKALKYAINNEPHTITKTPQNLIRQNIHNFVKRTLPRKRY
ncbi:hypothetical protein BC833DRAFT_142783 [Globomyces pollinis-pini]|nr:hypothetical protein BC833DRAFT_142783 [Globomyces pollinis-pini]